MLKTIDIPGVEILSTGTWHGTGCPAGGCSFTEADLDGFVASFDGMNPPPVKLGHDDEQKLLQADGYPAAGWLHNIRREGEKLLADVLKVPATIAELMQSGAYRNRSVEMVGDQITALALLGADMPAVENLSDIVAWYSKQQLAPQAEARVIFSNGATSTTISPEPTLAPGAMKYADHADDVLARVVAFKERTEQLATLRAKDGRPMTEANRERIAALIESVDQTRTALARFVEPPPAEEQDYTRVMRARLRAAELRQAALTGA